MAWSVRSSTNTRVVFAMPFMSRSVPFSYSSFIAFHGVVHREPNVPSTIWTGLTLFEGRGSLLKKAQQRAVARAKASKQGGCARTAPPWRQSANRGSGVAAGRRSRWLSQTDLRNLAPENEHAA